MPKGEMFTVDEVLAALKATNGLISLAAKRLGVPPRTVYNYRDRHPEIREALIDYREELVDIAELSLRKALLAGDAWAVALVLRTLGRGRGYLEKAELEVAGNVNVVRLPEKSTDADSWAIAAREAMKNVTPRPDDDNTDDPPTELPR